MDPTGRGRGVKLNKAVLVEFDDQPLNSPAPVDDFAATRARTRSLPIILLAIAGLVIGGIGAWWWQRDEPPPPAEAQRTATDVPVTPAAETARPLPPLDQMDTFIRALVGALSTSPELARWLATDDLVRQMAHAIDRVSRGASPARDLRVLSPNATFNTSGPRNRLVLDPASYRRYDALASTVSSIDAQAAARAYITIRPRLDEAYRGLGRTEGGVDPALDGAIAVLLATPRVDDPIPLVPGRGATYAFADSRLEKLSPAQKQLLRMGPENVARIQKWLQEFKTALRATQ